MQGAGRLHGAGPCRTSRLGYPGRRWAVDATEQVVLGCNAYKQGGIHAGHGLHGRLRRDIVLR